MINQRSNNPLVFALLAALLMGWGSHATSWLISPAHHSSEPPWHDHHHAHALEHVSSCALCELQHVHVHVLGDHVHETPHPMLLLGLSAQPERADVPAWPRAVLPEGPISRIERPPRA
jgi:hypothetical protein